MALIFRGVLGSNAEELTEAPKSRFKASNTENEAGVPAKYNPASKEDKSSIGVIQRAVDLQQKTYGHYTAVLHEYQENIRRSESLRAQILKGLATGQDKEYLLDKAVECISCMTGDESFYESARKKM